MCRSVPQIVVVSMRTTTSVGSWMAGSGTSSHALLPGPWNTSAFMIASEVGNLERIQDGGSHPSQPETVAPARWSVAPRAADRAARMADIGATLTGRASGST
jgi:hypothetical protein